jgi:hypothetical protein
MTLTVEQFLAVDNQPPHPTSTQTWTYVCEGICRVSTTFGINSGVLECLFGLGFSLADVVVVSDLDRRQVGRWFAVRCSNQVLQSYLANLLVPFGWENRDGSLFSPNELGEFAANDLNEVIRNAAAALKAQVAEISLELPE